MAAIDIDIGTHNKTGAIRGQKCNRTGDVISRAPTPEWNLGTPARFLLLQAASEKNFIVKFQAVGQWSLDPTRANGIDQDVMPGEVVRKRLHQGMLRGIADCRCNPLACGTLPA